MTINVHAEHDRYAERDTEKEVGRTEYPAQNGVNAFRVSSTHRSSAPA